MAKTKRAKDDHCVMRNGQPFCLNCGESYVINLPAPVNVFTGAINGFIKAHRHCKKTWTEPEVDMHLAASSRAIWWLKNGDRGASSETMFANLVDIKGDAIRDVYKIRPRSKWDHPHDPDDFHRCHKLLEAVPELREELPRMKKVSKVWSRLVDNWDRLTEMLLAQKRGAGSSDIYDFMKQLGC